MNINFPVFVVILAVAVRNFAEDAAGIADGDHIRWNVVRHHAARTDDAVLSDGHAGQQNRAGPDPDVAADPDRNIELGHLPPEFRVRLKLA